jgi:hypothetical protein
MWLIKRISFLKIASLILISCQIFAQHKTINDKVKLRNPPGQNINPITTENQDVIKTRIPEVQPESNYEVECETIEVTDIYYEDTSVYDKEISYIQNTNALEDVYPNFPLRFISGGINYIYSFVDYPSQNTKDVYELNFTIQPKSDDYFSAFGIVIIYSDSKEQLEVFNKKENLMYYDSCYTFTDEIILPQTGFINLRIGYYNLFNDLFYPEVEIPKKTDLLIYVNKPDKRIFYDE